MTAGRRTRRVVVPAVFILCLLAVVAVPSFLKARDKSQRNACLNNLRMLAAPMVCCVPMAYSLTNGAPLKRDVVRDYLPGRSIPTCPGGGPYIITWVVGGATPKCSVHGDLLGAAHGVKRMDELTTRQLQHE